MNNHKDYLGKSLLIITLATVGATALYAWTGPTANPPYTTDAPINVGPFKQTKMLGGDICVMIGLTEKCLSTVSGLQGPTGPQGPQGPTGSSSGDNLGNHTAVQALNMNYNSINNIGGLNFPSASGLGKVLTSDATGNASWQMPAAPATAPAATPSLGVGQSWVELVKTINTGSRSMNTTYKNETGKPIEVVAILGYHQISVMVDGAAVYTYPYNAAGATANISFVVPNNSTYSIKEMNTGAGIWSWSELR